MYAEEFADKGAPARYFDDRVFFWVPTLFACAHALGLVNNPFYKKIKIESNVKEKEKQLKTLIYFYFCLNLLIF